MIEYALCYTRSVPKHSNCWRSALLLGPWDFFDDQTRHWLPACMTVRVSTSGTVSNVDTNSDFSLVNVFTVAFYCSRSVVEVAIAWHIPNDINGQRAAALGAIEGDEPSLATGVAVEIKVSLINNPESGVIFPLVKNTILQNTKAIFEWIPDRHKCGT